MEKVQIIILAAGKGKRMNSEDIPKVLIEINNEPIIKYALKSIKESKICKKPIIVIGFQGQKVVQALGTNYNYIEQKEQLQATKTQESAEFQECKVMKFTDLF